MPSIQTTVSPGKEEVPTRQKNHEEQNPPKFLHTKTTFLIRIGIQLKYLHKYKSFKRT